MLESRLTQEARVALSRYSSANASQTLLPLWRRFEDFLQTRGALPSCIHEISEESLHAYATFLDYQDCHVDDALIGLGAVLLVCLHAGYNAKTLRSIVIPRIRRPLASRQWDAFRVRTYEPLDAAQLARERRQRARRSACASVTGQANDGLT